MVEGCRTRFSEQRGGPTADAIITSKSNAAFFQNQHVCFSKSDQRKFRGETSVLRTFKALAIASSSSSSSSGSGSGSGSGSSSSSSSSSGSGSGSSSNSSSSSSSSSK